MINNIAPALTSSLTVRLPDGPVKEEIKTRIEEEGEGNVFGST
jgi:hypothetical protein